MKTQNPYDNVSPEGRAWDKGWCAGYDDNEETWVKQILPIVGELEEHIRYDWENNDCLQVGKIKMIFDVFIQYAPEHDWLEQLIKDAVDAYKQHQWGDLSKGELEDLRHMASRFGQSIDKKFLVSFDMATLDIEVEAEDEQDAIDKAIEKAEYDYSVGYLLADADSAASEI